MKTQNTHQLLFNYDEQDLLIIKFLQEKYDIKTATGAVRKALELVSEMEKIKKELDMHRALSTWAERVIRLQDEARQLIPNGHR